MALDLWYVFVNKNISWRRMMHACSAFIIYPGTYSANFVLEIHSYTIPCHLTDDSKYPTPSQSIELRQHVIPAVCFGPRLISNVLLAGGRVVYLRNHLFFHVPALACIQNNKHDNISGLLNQKHVRIQ